MNSLERDQHYIKCPECNEDIPIAWWGDEDNVHFCEKCKLLKTINKSNTEYQDET